jgi:angio-associated migratory cell protein
MWNADENSLLNVFSGHGGSVTCGDFTPDGTNFSSYFLDRSSFIFIIRVIYFTLFIFLLLDTLGKVICTGSDDATLRIWNPKSGENIHIMHGMLISLNSVFPIYKS